MIGILKAVESGMDMQTAEENHENGWFRLHATIGIRNGLAIALGHVIMSFWGILGLVFPPPTNRTFVALGIASMFVFLQGAMAVVQGINYLDSMKLRRKGT